MIFNQEFGRAFYKVKISKNKEIYSLWYDFQFFPELSKEQFENWINSIKKERKFNITKISKTDIIQGGLKDKIEKLNKFYKIERYDEQEQLF